MRAFVNLSDLPLSDSSRRLWPLSSTVHCPVPDTSDARLVLDKFVYAPNSPSTKEVWINFAKGAFRFLTSSENPSG
jgi:hypothetical protein